MSKYEWERGSVIIPVGQYPKFRTALIRKWNEQQEELLEGAQAVFGEMKSAMKGLRGQDKREAAARLALAKFCQGTIDPWDEFVGDDRTSFDWFEWYFWPRGCSEHGAGALRTKAPMKKEFDLRPITRSALINLPNGVAMSLNDATRVLSYHVPENNHAVEHAAELPMVKAMFAALCTVDWKKGSGGTFWGNDEYTGGEDGEAGSGANYTTRKYGPLGDLRA